VEVLLLVVEQRLGRLRHEDLPAVPGGPDPGGAMDGKARVTTLRGDGLARVQAHADLDLDALRPRVGDERELRVDRCEHPVARAREDDEEGVPLRIHLVAAVLAEGVAQYALVLRQDLRVPLAQLLQEARRSLDVGEEEGDCTAR